jgi:hypothetical protein
MKSVFIIAILLFAGCVSRPVTLPAEHVITSRSQTSAGRDYWKPSEQEIATLEANLSRLWVRPDKRVSDRVAVPLSEYFVRYYGTIVSGRRVIIGEGVHRQMPHAWEYLRVEPETDAESGTTVVLQAFGGGTAFFHVRFDAGSKQVEELIFNAPL